eukprot:gene1895-biopygen1571
MRHLLLRNIPEAIQGGNSEGSLEKKQEYELFGGDDTLDRVLAGARQHESSVFRSGLGTFLVAAAMLAVIRGRLVAFNVNAIRTRAGRSGIQPGESDVIPCSRARRRLSSSGSDGGGASVTRRRRVGGRAVLGHCRRLWQPLVAAHKGRKLC